MDRHVASVIYSLLGVGAHGIYLLNRGCSLIQIEEHARHTLGPGYPGGPGSPESPRSP